MGVLKLFDFGFALGIEPLDGSDGSSGTDDSREKGLLYDKCGTPRYMAPEVGLMQGYALPADVYSFGILLWEICALTKPFGKIKTAGEFHRTVFEKGARPKVAKSWPPVLKELITGCWRTVAADRPEMARVKSVLELHAKELAKNPRGQQKKSSIVRRTLSAVHLSITSSLDHRTLSAIHLPSLDKK